MLTQEDFCYLGNKEWWKGAKWVTKNRAGHHHTLHMGQSQPFWVTFCRLGHWNSEFSLRSGSKEHYIADGSFSM